MSNKTRTTLKLIAIILVIAAVLMQMNFIIIPAIADHNFWIVVIASMLLLISSK